MDAAILALAERQHGVVSRTQLIDLGLSDRAIEHRIERGWLHPLYRAVYAAGRGAVSADGRLLAAALAAGPGAVLSHRSAAAAWELRRSAPTRDEITVPNQRRIRGEMRMYERTLPPDEVTTTRGIPVTTVPRTLFDLAAVLPRAQVERALDRAEMLRLTDPLSLPDLVERYAGRRGVRVIRAILEDQGLGISITRSDLEDDFLAFAAKFGLPRPATNVAMRLGDGRAIEADCVWFEQRLIVELDGHATHSTRRSFESDRERDRALAVAGWPVIRVTWRQIEMTPQRVAADLAAILEARTAGASLGS